jgi:guanylate kinase
MTSHEADVILAYFEAVDAIGGPPEVERLAERLRESGDPDLKVIQEKVDRVSEAMRALRNALVDVSNRDTRRVRRKPHFVARVTRA